MTDDQFWRIQGHLNAIELILQLGVLNLAQTQQNPFMWVQQYLEAVRQSGATLMPDVMEPSEAKRLKVETKAALDDFLSDLIGRAGGLKGAPGNP